MTFLLLPHTQKSQQRLKLISFSTLLAQTPSNESGFVHAPGDDGGIITPAESLEDPQCLKKKFWEICNPQINRTMERLKFHTRSQKQGESIESFTSDLRVKAKCCQISLLPFWRPKWQQAYLWPHRVRRYQRAKTSQSHFYLSNTRDDRGKQQDVSITEQCNQC